MRAFSSIRCVRQGCSSLRGSRLCGPFSFYSADMSFSFCVLRRSMIDVLITAKKILPTCDGHCQSKEGPAEPSGNKQLFHALLINFFPIPHTQQNAPYSQLVDNIVDNSPASLLESNRRSRLGPLHFNRHPNCLFHKGRFVVHRA